MPSVITPTVGRKIWYSPTPAESSGRKLGEQPFDATVVYVHSDRCVNLSVRDHNGESFPKTSVTLLQEGDAPSPEGGTCSWMPYQRWQAARADAAEAGKSAG